MKHKTFIVNRIIAVMLLTSVFTFVFVWSSASASKQPGDAAVERTAAAEVEEPTSVYQPERVSGRETSSVVLSAQKRGFPLINLQDGKRLETKFVGSENSIQSFASAQALTMTNADLNLDGAPDLVVGYAGGSGGGHLALYAGNPDALSARTPEAFEAIKEGSFPEPFRPEARLIALPVAPDFIGTGDFNRDGWKDIVAAQRGANSLVLLAGNAKGSYKKPQTIELPGSVTALLAENIDPADGQADVAVALSDSNGAWLFVFDDQHDAFAEQPRMYPLPAEATSLALGQLDDAAPMDILAAAGGKAVVIHGSYTDKNDSPENQLRANAGQVETLSADGDVAAVQIGHFVWDRENQPEIALLGASGTIRILQRGNIDRRQYSEEEWEAHWTKQEEQDQIELLRRSADPTNRSIGTTKQKQTRQTAQSWTEADSFQLSSGFNFSAASPSSVFTSARMTTEGIDNLIIADAASRKIKVLLQNREELKSASGESNELSATGALAAVEFDSATTPTVVLPMRLGVMTRPGLVMMDKDNGEVSYALAAPTATFAVTKTADTYDGTCDADCSLREAIRAANLAAGADTVTVPPGTYTLTIGPSDDSPADPSAQGSGDLDVRQDLTIIGAGQGATIIQAGTSAENGIDRVLHTRQTSVGIPDISISGVTIRHGRCSSAGSVANPNGARCNTGGAGLLHSVDDLGAVTITDSTITTNWNVATNAGSGVFFLNGAGVFIGRGDTVLTNTIVSNNENGASGSDNGGDGGGVLFGFSSATNINTAVLTNVTMTGNIARIIGTDTLGGNGGGLNHAYDDVDISGGTYSNNSADLDGGAFYLLTKTDLFGNASVTGNTAKRDGGGIWSDPLNTDGTPATNTVANLTIRNNIADSDNVIQAQFPGDPRGAGGGIYHDRANLTLTTVTLGGTSGGQPNTSYDGGGLGHRYRAPGSTNNVSTITINGGSIVGNIANNDGGGVFHDATRTAGANSTISIAPTTAVTLTNNLARNNGGGFSNSGGATATLNNMQLRSNQANSDNSGGGDGGAFYQNTSGSTTTFNGTLTIGGSGFANSGANGGGIRNAAGTITIPANASITHNTASAAGGGISNAGTLSALAAPTITSNSATGTGGGIHNTGTLGAITNPALNFNSASNGGGIFNSGTAMSITSGSVSNNTATSGLGFGGGIEQGGSSASIVSNVAINNNNGTGIVIASASSLDATSNTITGNTGDGIIKTGTGTGSHFNSNTIHSNGGIGIDLSDNSVTPNDANDGDTGPNNLQNFPVINYVRRGTGVASVTLNSPNGKYRIQYYKNAACDPSGHGEGEVLITSQVVDITSVATQTFFSPALAFDSGIREQITATATHDANNNGNFDDDGSTSEFSACRQVNTLPTITAQPNVFRQQGSLISNSQIAAVNDIDQTEESLIMSVNGGSSATVNGVTVSNIAVSAAGVVTADIIATCSATNASFTLRVTDGATEFNEATLNVAITANTAPTVGNYADTTVNAGSNITVTPDAAPTDNGSIASITASAAPAGFTGTFSSNTTTGALTITTAAPAGTYTITVTTTDNCGATTLETFTLTVNAIPTITAQAGITRQQGSAGSNSQIAAVNDADQSEETLAVTIKAVGDVSAGTGTATVNGVTVSNIAVSAAGVVTADIIASCSATNASFTLRVTDSNGAFNESTLNVAVTTNTAPTIGTYANTNLNSGSGTTVSPTAAPADNGSVSTVTVAAAGFTGDLTVNPATGVVTIANANPGGSYTVIVTLTDNCGTTATAQFTLTVSYTMTGVVRYGTTPTNEAAKFVPDVTITADGTPPVSDATDAAGTYTLNGLGTGAYTVTPTKTGDVNGIESLDATRIQQHLVGLITLTPNQLIAADVDNNGVVNSLDAARIQQYLVMIATPNIIGQWKFVPANRQYASISSNLSGEDYEAILVGDVSGNWTAPSALVENAETRQGQTGAGKISGRAGTLNSSIGESAQTGTSITVSLPSNALASTGNNVIVPVTIGAVPTGSSIESFDFTVFYDPAVLQPASPAGSNAGTLSSGCSVLVNSPTSGRVIVSGACGAGPITTTTGGTLYNLNFTVIGTANQTSDLSFVDPADSTLRFQFNNGTPSAAATDGEFTVIGPTAASVSVSGKVTNAAGRGIGNVLITMTDSQGNQRTAQTTSFGYYKFDSVAGETITLTAKARRMKFVQSSIVRTTNQSISDADFISQ